jgi:hypothetical protein
VILATEIAVIRNLWLISVCRRTTWDHPKPPQVRKQSQHYTSALMLLKCRHWSSPEQSNAEMNSRPGVLLCEHKGTTQRTKGEEAWAQLRYTQRQLGLNALLWWERAKVYQGTLIPFCALLHCFLLSLSLSLSLSLFLSLSLSLLLDSIRPHFLFRLTYKLFSSLFSTIGTNEKRTRIKFYLSSHHVKIQQYVNSIWRSID